MIKVGQKLLLQEDLVRRCAQLEQSEENLRKTEDGDFFLQFNWLSERVNKVLL